MGIEKPYEVEAHTLGPPPPAHQPFDLRAHLASLIRADGPEAIRIAGHWLRVPPHLRADAEAERLRARVYHRMIERRPNADAHTWESFVSMLEGELGDGAFANEQLEHLLIETIDGL